MKCARTCTRDDEVGGACTLRHLNHSETIHATNSQRNRIFSYRVHNVRATLKSGNGNNSPGVHIFHPRFFLTFFFIFAYYYYPTIGHACEYIQKCTNKLLQQHHHLMKNYFTTTQSEKNIYGIGILRYFYSHMGGSGGYAQRKFIFIILCKIKMATPMNVFISLLQYTYCCAKISATISRGKKHSR